MFSKKLCMQARSLILPIAITALAPYAPPPSFSGQNAAANAVGAASHVAHGAVEIVKNPFETEVEPHECVFLPLTSPETAVLHLPLYFCVVYCFTSRDNVVTGHTSTNTAT